MRKKPILVIAGASLAAACLFIMALGGGRGANNQHEDLLTEVKAFCAEEGLTDVECSEVTSTVQRHAENVAADSSN